MLKEIIVGAIILIAAFFIALQFRNFQQWLVWGVSEAESYLGSGTGELKLKYVYNLAITKFPWLTKIITYNMFKAFVDAALVKMRTMIENNEAIADILSDVTVVDPIVDEELNKETI